jgi:hypothetical protein
VCPKGLEGIASCHDITEKEAFSRIGGICSKSYLIHFKVVMVGVKATSGNKGELNFVGKCHDLIENKWWKNVAFWPCHDVDENK